MPAFTSPRVACSEDIPSYPVMYISSSNCSPAKVTINFGKIHLTLFQLTEVDCCRSLRSGRRRRIKRGGDQGCQAVC